MNKNSFNNVRDSSEKTTRILGKNWIKFLKTFLQINFMEIWDADSSVILEIIFDQPKRKQAEKLFKFSEYKHRYSLVISSIVLGEVVSHLCKEKNIQEKKNYFLALTDLLTSYPIYTYSPLLPSLNDFLSTLLSSSLLIGMDALVFSAILTHDSVLLIKDS